MTPNLSPGGLSSAQSYEADIPAFLLYLVLYMYLPLKTREDFFPLMLPQAALVMIIYTEAQTHEHKRNTSVTSHLNRNIA